MYIHSWIKGHTSIFLWSFLKILNIFLDPEKLLNDPRANDQDADPRILDAVKNGFAKNKGKLRS